MRLRCKTLLFARTLLVYALGLHLLVICAAAASPALHEWMHADADHADHDCAITLFASGAYHTTVQPAVAAALCLIPAFDGPLLDGLRDVSSFRFSGILEHAPPAAVA
jgi:hypothetical protein